MPVEEQKKTENQNQCVRKEKHVLAAVKIALATRTVLMETGPPVLRLEKNAESVTASVSKILKEML